MPLRILLVEPYFGGSHRAWAEGYERHSRHQVTLLTLPARFWKWRMQGGAVTLADKARIWGKPPELILASDMLNLPVFLTLTRDVFSNVPVAVYFHENQLTYPFPPGEKRDLTYAMINWLSMLVADHVFFNSHYHLEDWFAALPNLLKHFPDCSHLHRVAEVRAKSTVLPVGCDLQRFGPPSRPRAGAEDPPLILWNQRWEYDKKPERFFRALYALQAAQVPFRVVLAGKSHRQSAPEFAEARSRLGDRVIHFGYAENTRYVDLLRRADIVVSTAIHEFFGVAVVEAIYAGAYPVLPDGLSYPELIPERLHQRCLYGSFEGLLDRLQWALHAPETARALTDELRVGVQRFDWATLAQVYDRRMQGLCR